MAWKPTNLSPTSILAKKVNRQVENLCQRPAMEKRRRKFGYKVRTGCITWIRRKKCDEERPICRRCRDTGFKCDGYVAGHAVSHISAANASIVAVASNKNTNVAFEPQKLTPPDGRIRAIPLQRQILSDLRSPDSDQRFFQHFCRWTQPDLLDTAEFWNHYVLPSAHIHESVRLSIAAAGAAHLSFASISTPDWNDPPNKMCQPQHRFEALRQYNRAIMSITSSSTSTSQLQVPTVLICCLLFVCFESMMGRRLEAVRHLRAGFSLLPSRDTLAGHSPESRLIVDISDIFTRLAVEFAIFTNNVMSDVDIPDDLTIKGIAMKEAYDDGVVAPLRPFRNLPEASSALRKLDVDLVMSPAPGDTSFNEKGHSELMCRFQRWNTRFESSIPLLHQQSTASPIADDNQKHLQRLLHQRQQWLIIAQEGKDDKEQYMTELFDTCLDQAQRIAHPFLAQPRPTFSISGDLVSGLSMIAAIAGIGTSAHTRALELLCSLNHREGIWDSREISEMHEADLRNNDSQFWNDQPVPRALPSFVEAFHPGMPSRFSDGLLAADAGGSIQSV